MLASFSEFKFFQSFRTPVDESDDLRFLCEQEDEMGNQCYIEDARLIDISITGLGVSTKKRIAVGSEVTMSLQFRKMHLDLTGKVVRAFCNAIEDDEIIYGIEIDDEPKIKKFLEQFILSFSTDRLKECLVDSAIKERYTKASDGFEMFSLLLSLFRDITHFGDKEGFLDNMLEEVVRVINAQRASIFLINPDSNELEAVAALGIEKDKLKFDYRLGIAGSVFTTGVALNIDVNSDRTRYNEFFDKEFNFETRSIVCHPIHNREDKIIGVIEVINKRNQDRFSVEDEKTMKVLALVFSSVFHNYNPMSESGQIRRFSRPFDRKLALVGKTAHMGSLRSAIIKMKDLDVPVLIHGEPGVGKNLYAQILHAEGQRGLKTYDEIDCNNLDKENLEQQIFGSEPEKSKLAACQGGTVYLRHINRLPMDFQKRLFEVLVDGRLPGSNRTLDVRIIASTNEDLGELVDRGEFDQQFYELLNTAYVFIESLRRRGDDIPLLVDYFLKLECKKQGLLLKSFSPKLLAKFADYDWPGNIKELKTSIERAVLYNPKAHVISDIELDTAANPLIDMNTKKRIFGDLPHINDFHIPLRDRIAIVEREMILYEIKRNCGNKSRAAKEMGISREALRKKLLLSQSVLDAIENSRTHQEHEEEKKAA